MSELATVQVSGKAHRAASQTRPWLHKDHVLGPLPENGPFVSLVDENALSLGFALLDKDDEHPLKLVSTARTRDPIGLLRTRLERAMSRRKNDLMGADAYRLCHGEGDGVPRFFVDRFGDGLCITSVTPAMNEVARQLVQPLVDITGARVVVHYALRDHAEGTATRRQDAPFDCHVVHGDDPQVRFHHGGLIRQLDLTAGFHVPALTSRLDMQRYVRRWARGQVLDVKCGFGGFGMQLADAGAKEVVFVDDESSSLDDVQQDAQTNGIPAAVRTVEQGALQALHSLDTKGERFSVIVMHPAEVREGKDRREAAEMRLQKLHKSALKLVGEGGIYVTWPGTTAVDQETFERILTDAAQQGRKRLQVLSRMQAGPDHPVLVGMHDPSATTLLLRVLSTT